ncbi:hypothetical protein NDU88_006434 [Pleurodeles waltl]|uniref:Uncharacterized protein n=1 Tax=Pleurodeles waltl TaxID=8319 RepID=A0AAV7VQZ5_PLEWA|nr:hypothetical protein NDU88_006434 [Pleurodeles waltl]
MITDLISTERLPAWSPSSGGCLGTGGTGGEGSGATGEPCRWQTNGRAAAEAGGSVREEALHRVNHLRAHSQSLQSAQGASRATKAPDQ